MKNCPVCGAQLQDSDVFCNSCGARCETPDDPSQSAAQAVLHAEPPAAPGYVRPERVQTDETQQEPGAEGFAPPYAPPGYSGPQQADPRNAAPEKDPNRPLSTWSYALALFLMRLPLVGLVIQIIWAAGGTSSLNRQNLARGNLLLRCCIAALVLLLLVVTLAVALPLLRRFFDGGFDYFNNIFRYYY